MSKRRLKDVPEEIILKEIMSKMSLQDQKSFGETSIRYAALYREIQKQEKEEYVQSFLPILKNKRMINVHAFFSLTPDIQKRSAHKNIDDPKIAESILRHMTLHQLQELADALDDYYDEQEEYYDLMRN